MRRPWTLVALCALILASGSTVPAEEPSQAESANAEPSLEDRGAEFVDLMVADKHEDAFKWFDDTMKAALPADKLRATWGQLIGQVGGFQERTGTRTEAVPGYDLVFVTCRFESATLEVKVVFDPERRVAGLFFVPAKPPGSGSSYTPPDYADPDRYREEPLEVGEAWPLPGTLTRPLPGQKTVPALVLVHGSGPQDRDETVGPNKPFRDLALGLASSGIAVLRYDKRTQVHSGRLAEDAGLTVQEEVIEDALEAVALLRRTAGIDPDAVFVLGHSLGGMLIPRIATQDPTIAGFVVLAGAARPLHEMVVAQVAYLASLDGEVSPEERLRIDDLEQAAKRIDEMEPAAGDAAPVLGAPPSYWLDLKGYRPAEAARKIERPLLILQGGRDYQVTREDYDAWRGALSERIDVTFRLFDDLNHLFIAGKGPSTPDEYARAGHIAPEVIREIASWVRRTAAYPAAG